MRCDKSWWHRASEASDSACGVNETELVGGVLDDLIGTLYLQDVSIISHNQKVLACIRVRTHKKPFTYPLRHTPSREKGRFCVAILPSAATLLPWSVCGPEPHDFKDDVDTIS